MKQFLKKFFWVYTLPVAVYFGFIFFIDPLKCFRKYKEYYTGSFVSPNRENVCINLFENLENSKTINSFVFGNSCSHAVKSAYWMKYLPGQARIFHLDAYRETLRGILKKLEYIERNGNRIDHALIFIDRSTFSKKFKSYMYVMPKKLDNQSNDFYVEHLKALTSLKFMGSYLYYSVSHNNLPFMAEYHFSLIQPVSDNRTGDLTYHLDAEISKDSAKFFAQLSKKDWASRINIVNLTGNDSFEGLTNENVEYLNQIKGILVRNKTQFKIVINPLYDQQKLPVAELNVLQDIFGAGNVYDFSGVNEFTSDFRNYYDGLHYRPIVANEILHRIYEN